MDNVSRMVEFIKEGITEEKKIGLELEHFLYNEEFQLISYEEMSEGLKELSQQIGGEVFYENGKILGVIGREYSLSLEPGCQLEISIIPKKSIVEIQRIYDDFRKKAEEIFGKRGYQLDEKGVFPLIESGEMDIEELPLLPKERYQLMDQYFQNTGKYGKYMMRATASTQISIDFSSEQDASKKIAVLGKLAPIFALLTENRSGLSLDSKWKLHLIRNQIWREVDEERCGFFKEFPALNASFEEYASYIYSKKCIFYKEDGRIISAPKEKACEYFADKPIEDVDHVLSMFFPMVRLKKYIEYRVADSMPIHRALGYATLIKNILYNEQALEDLSKALKEITKVHQIYEAEDQIFLYGYDACIYGRNVGDWMEWLLDLATDKANEEEITYLNHLTPLTLLNRRYKKIIQGNETKHQPESDKIKEYLQQSTAKYHNRVVQTLYIPKLFTEEEFTGFEAIIADLYGIFDKVIDRYQKNKEYRRLFGFPKELEEFILLEKTYGCNVPMARIDLFYNEQTNQFKFCEFNTDGASAMNEDRELNIAFGNSEAYREFAKNHSCHTFELFDSWVEEVLAIYREYSGGKKELPVVGIVDFMESATLNEFVIFKEAFEKRGCKAEICDIRELVWTGDRCCTKDGVELDLIYRRAVTSDIMKHISQVTNFLSAVQNQKVCLVGDFRTQIVHNKILYKILHMEETLRFLSKKERVFVKNHIPYTISLRELFGEQKKELREEVYQNKDRWIIKPEDSYGSKGVFAGVELEDADAWKSILKENKEEKYILQEFCNPYRLDNIKFTQDGGEWIDTSNLTGLFVYHEKVKGLYSRVSYDQMISTQYNEMTLPTILIKAKREE